MSDTKTNNGGPAFPLSASTQPNGEYQWCEYGMSLRDYFAGQALVGLLSNEKRDGSIKCYASDSYAFADAMIAARNS
jgi:hypothetical protein